MASNIRGLRSASKEFSLMVSGEYGVSLLDVVISIALLGILFSISIPAISDRYSRYALKVATSTLRGDIEILIAKVLAQEQQFNLEINRLGYTIKPVTGEGKVTREFGHNIEALLPNGEPHLLKFYGSGVVSPATIALQKGGVSCQIIISLRGRSRVSC